LRALLAALIDYAGLFPPAGLEMGAAASAYDRYRLGARAWMLGSFVVPLARLTELRDTAPEARWPVSVLVPSLDALPSFGGLDVRALEVAPLEAYAIRAAGGIEAARVFYEVPLDDRMEARLDAIADVRAAAKVRTGGVTPEAFPPAASLADFVRGCAERGLAFKATAGLHHPVRGRYALTYQVGTPWSEMYGFLDFALVSELIRSDRVDVAEAARLLTSGTDALSVDSEGIEWNGHRISVTDLHALRSGFFLSFGSCSFEDPVADLERIGLL
jgi:hypothetical protein